MNDIKTIEELRASPRTIEGGCTALKRLEERTESKGQAPHKPTLLIPNATNRKAVRIGCRFRALRRRTVQASAKRSPLGEELHQYRWIQRREVSIVLR